MAGKLSWLAPGRVQSFFLGPGGRRSRFWEALGADPAAKRLPDPPKPPPGSHFGCFLEILEGLSHAFLHYFFACFFGRLFEGCSFNFLVFVDARKKAPTPVTP